MHPTRSLPIVIAVSIPSMALGQTVTYEAIPLGNTAMDISPDGRFIVGATDQDGNGFPDGTYLLDRQTDTMTILPAIGFDATSVSDDGTIVLGCMPDPSDGVEVAGMWTQSSGVWTSLGWLPTSLNCPSRSNGYELSGDGTVAVGLSWDGCSGRGFRWTQETGMVELEALGSGGNRASVVSSDGNIIGGFAQGSFSRTPAMWDGLTTLGTLLDPPNGDVVGEVQGMNDDGSILLGNWAGDAYMYTESGGVEIIGAGSIAPNWNGIAMDIDDAGTIVGFDTLLTNRRGWIRPAGETDMVTLISWVQANGDLPSGTSLDIATGISNDGKTIIGHNFFVGAWILNITPKCVGDIDDDGMVGFTDLTAVLGNWGPCVDCPEDLDGDGMVGFSDLTTVLAKWGPCP